MRTWVGREGTLGSPDPNDTPERDHDNDPDEAPETPLDEPRPPAVQDPPPEPDPRPYVVTMSPHTDPCGHMMTEGER